MLGTNAMSGLQHLAGWDCGPRLLMIRWWQEDHHLIINVNANHGIQLVHESKSHTSALQRGGNESAQKCVRLFDLIDWLID